MSSPGLYARFKLAFPKEAVAKDSDALRIGMLGAAEIAPMALINPAMLMSNVVVAAVAARDPKRAEEYAKKHNIARVHASYDDLLADPELDAIYNPLPNGLHYEWTVKALEHGKHVLLEKPATSNATQAANLFRLAKEKNLIVLEAYHYRFHPAAHFFKDLIQKHSMEHPIQKVTTIMSFPRFFSFDNIRFNYELAGGIQMDCSYTVGGARFFTDLEVDSIQSAVPKIVKEQVDGRMDVNLTLKGDANGGHPVHATLVASMTNPYFSRQTWSEMIPRISVETDDKIFTFKAFMLAGFWHSFTVLDKATGKLEYLPKVYAEGYSTYRYQLEAFVKAVQEKKEGDLAKGWVTAEDSILNMRALDSIYLAAGLKVRE